MYEAPPPQIIPATTQPTPRISAVEPELLELQGDHLVRITPYGQAQAAGQSNRPEPERASASPAAAPSAKGRQTEAAKPPSEAPTAVLVFRDGHQEEIGKYCIEGAIIHIDTDYWSTGSWSRTVRLSELDVPATLKLNQERGTNFRLPAGPYEVMIGG